MFKLNTSILLDHLTWPQVEKKIKQGWRSVVIGVGSIEQHGPHLPLFTDAFCGDVIGNEVARRIKKAFQAPTIRVGCSKAHMDFPGTMTLSHETLQKLIEEYCESLAHHGFQNMILIPTHGGNFQPIRDMLPHLQKNLSPSQVIAYTDFEELMATFHKANQRFHVSQEDAGLHSGEIETSIMLYIAKEWVQKDKIQKGNLGNFSVEEIYKQGTKKLSSNGVLGNPLSASAIKGKVYLEAYIQAAFNFVKKELKK